MIKLTLLTGGVSTAHDASLLMYQVLLAAIAIDGRKRMLVLEVFHIGRTGQIHHCTGPDEPSGTWPASHELERSPTVSKAAFLAALASCEGFVYSLLQGTDGEDGVYQGLLKVAGALTNLGRVYPAALSRHKWAQSLVAEHLVSTLAPIRTRRLRPGDSDAQLQDVVSAFHGQQCVLKPNDLGGSVHTLLVDELSVPRLRRYLNEVGEFAEEFLVQERIVGRELTVGCLRRGGRTTVLPVAEVVVEAGFLGFDQKWTDQGYGVRFLSDEQPLARRLADVSRVLFDEIGFDIACRFDYIASGSGIHFLEANSKPGLAADSFLTCMLHQAGMTLCDLVEISYEEARAAWRRKTEMRYPVAAAH